MGSRAYDDLGVVRARSLRRDGGALALYQEAIRLDPNYELIVARARAARGGGHNPPPESERPALRLLARKCSLLDLMLRRRLSKGTADQRKLAPGFLKERLNDWEFSSVRDPEELARSPRMNDRSGTTTGTRFGAC